ncbi:MAG: undecaprenyl-diphosphatase [Desulforhopalus sp.]
MGQKLELLKAMILGIVQGLTEFLPVSSSGHLVIGSELLNFQEQGVVFDVCLHLGTLVSVIVVFRTEILAMIKAPFQYFSGNSDKEVRRFFFWDIYVILATLPAVFVGLFFKSYVDAFFGSTLIAYYMLIVTGSIMVLAQYVPERDQAMNWWRSILVGCAQALAIMPGLSRSGSTIFVGMLLGVPRETIARFSFIMSIPAIVGAAVLQMGDLFHNPPSSDMALSLVVGTVMSACAGYFAIKLLLDIIRKNRLQLFGYYCLTLAGFGLVYHYFFAS